MKIIINPNLILWPSDNLKFAIPSTNFNEFRFFDFKESYHGILSQFTEPKEITEIKAESELITIQNLLKNDVFIPADCYDQEYQKSTIWSGLRFIDANQKTKDGIVTSRAIAEDENIYIVDDFFSEHERACMSFWFASSNYKLNDIDKEDSKFSRHWVNHLIDIETIIKYTPQFEKIDSKIRNLYADANLTLFEIKAYLSTFGDLATYHQDSEMIDTITVVVYFHNTWELDWHGEFIICDDQWEPQLCVFPKPGRMIVFNGKLPHRAGAPTKTCFEGRKTLVFRYKINN